MRTCLLVVCCSGRGVVCDVGTAEGRRGGRRGGGSTYSCDAVNEPAGTIGGGRLSGAGTTPPRPATSPDPIESFAAALSSFGHLTLNAVTRGAPACVTPAVTPPPVTRVTRVAASRWQQSPRVVFSNNTLCPRCTLLCFIRGHTRLFTPHPPHSSVVSLRRPPPSHMRLPDPRELRESHDNTGGAVPVRDASRPPDGDAVDHRETARDLR